MDIPEDILAVLTCSQCEAMLSRGPIFQQHDGAAVCGRCVSPERPATRNFIYEASVKLLRFPCKNKEFGCDNTVPFVEEKQENPHEEGCAHRQYLCPVVPAGQCEWLGQRCDLLTHCTTKHSDKVFRNAGDLTHDITKSSLQTYVLAALRFIFLIHTKVCITSGKIFYAVRCLGDASNASKFRFSVDVKRGKQLITKSHPVAQQGCLAIQEDTSMAVNINSLLEMLDGFKGTTFTLTVWDTTGCNKCDAEMWKYFYPSNNHWLCEKCAPSRRPCKNKEKGCRHMDINVKCNNHEQFFCSYITHCPICTENLQGNTLDAHYLSKHSDVFQTSGTIWQFSKQWGKINLVSTYLGLVRCRHFYNDEQIQICITFPCLSEELNETFCEVQFIDSITKHTIKYNPKIDFSSERDLYFTEKTSHFSSFSEQLEVSIVIKRVDPQ